MTGSGRVRRSLVWLAPVMLAAIALPAGPADAEETKVSSVTVVEGLKTIQQGLEDAAAARADKVEAAKDVEAVEPVWGMIEHTIKANDPSAYASFEEGIEGLETAITTGDAKKAEEAVEDFASTARSYVAAVPAAGGAPASASAPARSAEAAPSADRSSAAAAAPKPDAAAAATEAGDAALARTGSMSDALAGLAGLALALGGLAVIGGAGGRRRTAPIA